MLQGYLTPQSSDPVLPSINPFSDEFNSHPYSGTPSFPFSEFISKFGHCFLTTDAISVIKNQISEEGIISIGCGKGYTEWQLSCALGIDVLAYDVKRYEDPWFDSIQIGSSENIEYHPHRALYLAYPDKKPEYALEAVRRYQEAGGGTVIHVGPCSSIPFGCSPGFEEYVKQNLRLVTSLELPDITKGHRIQGAPSLSIYKSLSES